MTMALEGALPHLASSEGTTLLSDRERRLLVALAEAALPAGERFDAGGEATVRAFEAWLRDIPLMAVRVLRAAYVALDAYAIATHRRTFASLSIQERTDLLLRWERSPSPSVRSMLRALLSPLKLVHFERPSMYRHVGCHTGLSVVRDEPARWMSQVTNGREVEEDLEITCEVVVIGTGAGGAAAAYELASRGRAVLLLEEGDYHRRSSFRGSVSEANRTMYREQGLVVSFGNVSIPVMSGRAVGGSTVVNSGTCYRAPERTFAGWRSGDIALSEEFSSSGLSPYYERVEAMLQVAPADKLYLGEIGPIIARGAERMNLHHGPLTRNAPGCDGQGICCFGCPTGAKRSTDVSYVPEALKRGAQLITAAHVTSIDRVAGRARGVTATLGGKGGKKRKLTVKADVVIVAGGTLMTPLLLERSGLGHPMLGKNLSVHPATKVFALFDKPVEQWKGIPQGYTIDHYADMGLMFEGGSVPLDIAALGVPWTGKRLIDLMEKYPYLATFGLMIQDESRGRVRTGLAGAPLVTYDMNRRDLGLLQRGVATLTEVFQEAGASRVLPLVAGHDEVSTKTDLDKLRAAKLHPGDFEVTAFHPLGTCRIGGRRETSCLDSDHAFRGVPGLYVCDGSAVPSSLGVNPQMTIMALALRAAERIDATL